RAADSTSVSSTVCRSKVERLITLSTSAVAVCCSRVSCSSRRSCATSVSWPEAEELLWRTAFRVFTLRLRALAGLLLALERRRIAHPKPQYSPDLQSTITPGFCDQRNGVQGSFCTAAILSR